MAWSDFWGMIASAVLSGISSSSKNKSDKKKSAAEIALTGDEERKTVGYSKALDYYYDQMHRDESRRGLADYSQFSTLKNWAPEYKATFTQPPPTMPTKPLTAEEQKKLDEEAKKKNG